MGIFYGEFTSFGWLAGLDTALWASYLAAYLSRDALPPIDGASVLQRTDSQSRPIHQDSIYAAPPTGQPFFG
ncbi:MAG: hypothetical protein M9928_09470 [Anaerolineae bacterium]|nr:hypothetical protein [Anaerolineae bacterium]MCO5189311.1 hypothetical protein [Anaerolineae bacterium]MCO5192895.1 hypothetical protein [Anaerolineae bacterium]MCO5198300.1 hypothetical protein [Anaerolineae bacterium]MCO5205250.1 hypothetical protein [Anaerolineae bacterium]